MGGGTLGPLESAVMDAVWEAEGPVTVRAVARHLGGDGPAYTTVATVLGNLHAKGWVDREQRGLVWFYRPVLDRSERAAQDMHRALAGSDRPGSTLLRFVGAMSPGDVRTLRRLVEAADEGEPGS
ncbi:BlaI/MecI/CopY family transcriptional regulator [Nocardiopsis sp. NPDC057823]|uniref:BlaI/MecI/CopY family transcriptional regulator n=1 Tax=Nocardiopsis TaxID=2013 RepID=UPI00366E1D3C